MKHAELYWLASQIYAYLPCLSESCNQCQNEKVCELAVTLMYKVCQISKEEEIYDNVKKSNNR